jgi:UDP-N-acetylglucosamine 1-carboxyvinyltransferase
MYECIEVVGGGSLKGSVVAGGAKNAALPLLMATLLTDEPVTLSNVPALEDITHVRQLLEALGSQMDLHRIGLDGGTVTIQTKELSRHSASHSLIKALRASFWILGPLLARCGEAQVSLPGGDIIGARPVDIHLEALTAMGANIELKHGVVFATAPHGLRPAHITFRYPSVGATHQILMVAARVSGTTIIEGAAREPEIESMAELLTRMGASIEGVGTSRILISGTPHLSGTSLNLIGDRIEAGTYLCAGVATRGKVTVNGVRPAHVGKLLDIFSEMGCEIERAENSLTVDARRDLRGVSVTTGPFPELATDLQAPLLAALCTVEGESSVEETVYEARFRHVAELWRLGAHIELSDRCARIIGTPKLSGAAVEGHDIRAAASLVVAGLAAEGSTFISEPHHLRRGYERLEEKIAALGGTICNRIADAEDLMFSGC